MIPSNFFNRSLFFTISFREFPVKLILGLSRFLLMELGKASLDKIVANRYSEYVYFFIFVLLKFSTMHYCLIYLSCIQLKYFYVYNGV